MDLKRCKGSGSMFTHLYVAGEITFLSSFKRAIFTTEGFGPGVAEQMLVKVSFVS